MEAGRPSGLRLASVGSGTSRVLEAGGVAPIFSPSKANAETLAAELPCGGLDGSGGRVLYPSSSKARKELQTGLAARDCGFSISRLNTYSTGNVTSLPADLLAAASAADIVTFASPSAVRAWADLVLPALQSAGGAPAAACIGQTSATAAQEAGLPRIYFAQDPGLDGWVQAVVAATRRGGGGGGVSVIVSDDY